MASLSASTPANLILGFSPRALIPRDNAVRFRTSSSPASSRLRFEGTRRLKINQRQLTVSATNSDSAASSQKPSNEEPVVNETSKVADGPPLLTILAAVFVVFIFCWLIGSIILWLISLIVNVPSPK